MIRAEKVLGRDGKDWIKIQFRSNPAHDELIRGMGGIYVPKSKAWAIRYEDRAEFERVLGDYLIVWEDEDVDGRGGISEDNLPDQPIIDGYSVEYNEVGDIVGSEGFKTSPWGNFQVKGFNALVSMDFLILADDAGLGKSWQVATAMEARKKMGQLKRGVVVCKASLLYNWRNEIHQHTHEKAVIAMGTTAQRYKMYGELMNDDSWTFLIISYETFRQDAANIQTIDNVKQLDFCILDEAHKIKNPMSKLGMSVHVIPSFRYRYVLTATPLPNNPLESFNYLKFGRSVDMNWFDFRKYFAIFGGYGGGEIVGYQNIRELKALLQMNMLRRRKQDKLKDLPDVTYRIIPIQMTPLQSRMYDAVREEVLEELRETDLTKIPNALAKLLRLQQVTDSLDIIGAKPSPQNSAKLKALDEMLEELVGENGEKVIIFSRFRTMVEIMEERYAKYNPAVIHGDINSNGKSERTALRRISKEHDISELSKKELDGLLSSYMASARQQEVDRFQKDSDCKIFIGSSPACREGLTLTAATHVIFIDCEWTWDYVYQALSRAHRIGQLFAVTTYFLQCLGTIDEKVHSIIMRKKSLSEQMIDQGVLVVAETDYGTILELVGELETEVETKK